jgi:hypothetical protein
MKLIKFTGTFISNSDTNINTHTIDVSCTSFLQAFFLLTAKAIESGKHYQLATMINEYGELCRVDNISSCCRLFRA